MAELINMKQKKESDSKIEVAEDRPAYPYGLEIRLDNESVGKLGLTPLPDVGSEMMLMAKVNVTDISENKSVDNGINRSVSLQITDMMLKKKENEESTADKLFG